MSYFFAFLGLFVFATVAYAGKSFAPWVPAWKKDLPRIFRLANLQPGEIFYDLGCGNGKTVIYAVRNFAVTAIGVEIAIPLYLVCLLRKLFIKNKTLIFKYKSLFNEDLSKADVVYFFGMPDKLKSILRLKLEKELKPGARVISYVFPVEPWTPTLVDKPNPKDISIYFYQR